MSSVQPMVPSGPSSLSPSSRAMPASTNSARSLKQRIASIWEHVKSFFYSIFSCFLLRTKLPVTKASAATTTTTATATNAVATRVVAPTTPTPPMAPVTPTTATRPLSIAQVQQQLTTTVQQEPIEQLKQPTAEDFAAMETTLRKNEGQAFLDLVQEYNPAAMEAWLNAPFKDSPHFLPLQQAIFHDNQEIATCLLKLGADPLRAKNPHYYNFSSLQYAAVCQKSWFIELCMEHLTPAHTKVLIDFYSKKKQTVDEKVVEKQANAAAQKTIGNHLSSTKDPLNYNRNADINEITYNQYRNITGLLGFTTENNKVIAGASTFLIQGPMAIRTVAAIPRAVQATCRAAMLPSTFVAKKLLAIAPQKIQNQVQTAFTIIHDSVVTPSFSFIKKVGNGVTEQYEHSLLLKLTCLPVKIIGGAMLAQLITSHPYLRAAAVGVTAIDCLANVYSDLEKNSHYRNENEVLKSVSRQMTAAFFRAHSLYSPPLPYNNAAAHGVKFCTKEVAAAAREENNQRCKHLLAQFPGNEAVIDNCSKDREYWEKCIPQPESSWWSTMTSSYSNAQGYLAGKVSQLFGTGENQ